MGTPVYVIVKYIHLPTKPEQMKKTLYFLTLCLVMACGKKSDDQATAPESAPAVAPKTYSVVIDGLYKKDDSITVCYMMGSHFQYEKPISLKVLGSPLMQRLTVNIPSGIPVENVAIVASTNKQQDSLRIRNISIVNGDKVVVNGENYKHAEFFMLDESFAWDEKNERYAISHKNQYPPGIRGNEKVEAILKN